MNLPGDVRICASRTRCAVSLYTPCRNGRPLKRRLQLTALLLPLLLGGCLTPFIEGATEAYDHSLRDPPLRAAAAGGDPAAQYKLGNSYCCHGGGPLDAISIYDNEKATRWYCLAARQGYGPAQLRLARIYSGHPISGLRVTQHVSSAVGNPDTDIAVALMWADVAAAGGDNDAKALRDDLAAQAGEKQRARAALLGENWRTAPCQWTEVFVPGKQPDKRVNRPATGVNSSRASG